MLRLSLMAALAATSLSMPAPELEPRQGGGAIQIFSTTTTGYKVVQLAPDVFTSFRVYTESYVYTLPGASTASAAAGSVAFAGPAVSVAATPAAIPAVSPAAATTQAAAAAPTPATGGGLLGAGNVASAVVQATATVPIANVAATACVGILVNGVCQPSANGAGQATTAAAATSAGGGGPLGLGNVASAVVQATATVPIANVAATVCLGVLINGVCQSSANAGQATAAAAATTAGGGLLGLPNVASAVVQASASVPVANVAATVCLGILVNGVCQSTGAGAASTAAATANTAAGGGLLGGLATLPGAVLSANLGATVSGNVLGLTLPTIGASVAVCLGILVNGVCQPSAGASATTYTLPSSAIATFTSADVIRSGVSLMTVAITGTDLASSMAPFASGSVAYITPSSGSATATSPNAVSQSSSPASGTDTGTGTGTGAISPSANAAATPSSIPVSSSPGLSSVPTAGLSSAMATMASSSPSIGTPSQSMSGLVMSSTSASSMAAATSPGGFISISSSGSFGMIASGAASGPASGAATPSGTGLAVATMATSPVNTAGTTLTPVTMSGAGSPSSLGSFSYAPTSSSPAALPSTMLSPGLGSPNVGGPVSSNQTASSTITPFLGDASPSKGASYVAMVIGILAALIML